MACSSSLDIFFEVTTRLIAISTALKSSINTIKKSSVYSLNKCRSITQPPFQLYINFQSEIQIQSHFFPLISFLNCESWLVSFLSMIGRFPTLSMLGYLVMLSSLQKKAFYLDQFLQGFMYKCLYNLSRKLFSSLNQDFGQLQISSGCLEQSLTITSMLADPLTLIALLGINQSKVLPKRPSSCVGMSSKKRKAPIEVSILRQNKFHKVMFDDDNQDYQHINQTNIEKVILWRFFELLDSHHLKAITF